MSKYKDSNLAFYKRTGESWTGQDIAAISEYMGYPKRAKSVGIDCNINPHEKWVYNMDQEDDDLANWSRQAPGQDTDEGRSFLHMAFEDINKKPTELKTFRVKDYT